MDNNSNNVALGVGLLGGIVIGPLLISFLILCICICCCIFSLCLTATFGTMAPQPSYSYDDFATTTLLDIDGYIGQDLRAIASSEDVRVANESLTLTGPGYELELQSSFGVINRASAELTDRYCSRNTNLSLSDYTYFEAVGIDYTDTVRLYDEPDYTYRYGTQKLRLSCSSNDSVIVTLTGSSARG